MLDDFLRARGHSSPTGAALYTYRCNDAEYAALKKATAAHLRWFRPDEKLAAMFCLFVAEWWRRSFDGGAWSWEKPLQALDNPPVKYGDCVYMAQVGVKWWRRPLQQRVGATLYLLTLASEGGFPANLLRREGNRFQRFFRGLLDGISVMSSDRVTALPADAEALIELGKRWQHVLPEAMRRDAVAHVGALLVVQVWLLRNEFAPVDPQRPIEDLDRRAPSWRDRLPLQLDDTATEHLLRGLVRDIEFVVRGAASRGRLAWHVTATVTETDVLLARELVTPDRISVAELRKHLGIDESISLGRRLPVQMRDSQSQLEVNAGDFVARHGGDSWSFEPGPSDPNRRLSARSEWTLIAELPNLQRIEIDNLPRAHALDSFVPWVFAQRGGTEDEPFLELVGLGGAHRREEKLFLSLPRDAAVEAEPGVVLDCIWQPETSSARRWITVAGGATITASGETWITACRLPQDVCGEYVLRGRVLEHHVGLRQIYKGIPDLWYGEPLKRVDKERIQVRRAGGEWHSLHGLSTQPWGKLELRHVQGTATLFKATLEVVPLESRLEVEMGTPGHPGAWLVSVPGAIGGHSETAERLSAAVSHPSGLTFRPAPAATHPPHLRLHVSGRHGETAEMVVAFPIRFTAVTGRDGSQLVAGSTLHLSRLSGVVVRSTHTDGTVVTAQLFKTTPKNDEDTFLGRELTVRAPRPSSGHVVSELDLGTLAQAWRRLLASTDVLDAVLKIKIESLGIARPPIRLDVRRYDWRVIPVEDELGFHLTDATPGNAEQAILEARRLESIGEPAIELVRSEGENRWNFPGTSASSGTWLITARDGDWHRGRPLAKSWMVGEGASASPTPLVAAIQIGAQAARHGAIRDVLTAMADDFGHTDWPMLLEFLPLLKEIPPATFDVIRLLRVVPEAAVAMLIMCSEPADAAILVRTLDDMAFLWEVVPLATWARVFGRWADTLQILRQRPELQSAYFAALADKTERIKMHVSHAEHGLAAWAETNQVPDAALGISMETGLCRKPGRLGTGAFRYLREITWQNLMRVHAETDRWPGLAASATPLLDKVVAKMPGAERDAMLRELRREDGGGTGYRKHVVEAPLVAALACRFALGIQPDDVFLLCQCRDFDPDFFEAELRACISLLPPFSLS